jgi:hypothetical protein
VALEINRGGRPMVEATEKLWLTAEKDELVPDGDERAAFLFCVPGQRVSQADAERYGMFKPDEPEVDEGPADGEVEKSTEDDGQADETKAAEPAEDKQAPTPANKQRRGPRAGK